MRPRLTYGNVLSTLVVFVVLAGGTAYAANQLAKNSVGTKQLKKNSVTAKKIKKNAVTKAKIKSGAVDSSKVADGAVTGAKIDAASTPFSQVIARMRGNSTQAYGGSAFLYGLNDAVYTQGANEANQYLGWIDVNFAAGCAPPREAVAFLLLDAPNPLAPTESQILAIAIAADENGGDRAVRGQFVAGQPFTFGAMAKAPPSAAVQHSFSILFLNGICSAGSGVSVTGAGVDVIGLK